MVPTLLAIALAAARPGAVAARVGSDSITVAEVAARAEARHVTEAAALDDLIKQALVATAARGEGLGRDPGVVTAIEAERRRLAVERLLHDEVTSKVKVNHGEVAQLFHATHDEVRLSMVVRATRAEAEETLERLRAGAGLIEEARSSIDPVGRARSGVLGWLKRADLSPELSESAFSAAVGEPAGPVVLNKGFAVIVVHERRLGGVEALQREAKELRRELEERKRDGLRNQLLQALRRKGTAGSDAALLEREALRRGLGGRPEVAAALRSWSRSVLAKAYVKWIAQRVPAPTEREVSAAYDERRNDFWVPASRQCLVLSASTEQDAQQVRSRLLGGDPIDSVLHDGFAPAGQRSSETVQLTDSQIDAMIADQGEDQHIFAWTVRRTNPGEWTPVQFGGQWHVVRCDAPQPRHRRPLAEVSGALAEELQRERVTAEVDRRLKDLRKRVVVRIHERALPAQIRG